MPRKVVVNKPINWEGGNISEAVKSLYFEVDDDNNVKAQPVVILDPATSPTDFGVAIKGLVSNGAYAGQSQKVTIAPMATAVDSIHMAENVNASTRLYNNIYANMEAQRTPTIMKSATAAAAVGTTDIWTPGAGKKFRLMGGVVTMGGLIAAAAIRDLTLIEETAGTVLFHSSLTIPVLGGNIAIPFNIPGNGFLASTANKKLQVVTSGGTYSTGQDSIVAWGTEE